MSLVTAENLVKDYRSGDVVVHAIRGVDFTIEPASFVCFVGPSGSGKSTLLNMIGCLDPPTGGRLAVSGTDVSTLGHRAAAAFRGEHVGFVFQDFNLIPVLTASENVEYPLIMVQNWPLQKRRERVKSLLAAAGIASPTSFPAVRNSALPWPAPWSPTRSLCWPTSRRQTLIAPPPCGSSG